MMRPGRLPVLLLVPLLLGGCASISVLTMTREKPPLDRSVVSPKLARNRYDKIMVIPPSGTARGAFEPQIVLFEREFLRRGMTVISGAVTGKVVLEAPGTGEERKSESAALLSDLERALIMAKRTGADAILQVGDFTYAPIGETARCFVTDRAGRPFREVEPAEYETFTGARKQQYAAPELRFIGRVVDVANGEVVASLDVALPLNHVLPAEYTARFVRAPMRNPEWTQRDESFPYASDWPEMAKKPAEQRIIEAVVARLAPP